MMPGVPTDYAGIEAVLLLFAVDLVTLQNAKGNVSIQQVVYAFGDDHV